MAHFFFEFSFFESHFIFHSKVCRAAWLLLSVWISFISVWAARIWEKKNVFPFFFLIPESLSSPSLICSCGRTDLTDRCNTAQFVLACFNKPLKRHEKRKEMIYVFRICHSRFLIFNLTRCSLWRRANHVQKSSTAVDVVTTHCSFFFFFLLFLSLFFFTFLFFSFGGSYFPCSCLIQPTSLHPAGI